MLRQNRSVVTSGSIASYRRGDSKGIGPSGPQDDYGLAGRGVGESGVAGRTAAPWMCSRVVWSFR